MSSSIRVRRAFFTRSEPVVTTILSAAGATQEAANTRPPVSTTHSRQTPTGVSFCWWQRVGIAMPFILALAGGTLIYITSNEIIPESHSHGHEGTASSGVVLGFLVTMVLQAVLH